MEQPLNHKTKKIKIKIKKTTLLTDFFISFLVLIGSVIVGFLITGLLLYCFLPKESMGISIIFSTCVAYKVIKDKIITIKEKRYREKIIEQKTEARMKELGLNSNKDWQKYYEIRNEEKKDRSITAGSQFRS